MQLFTHLLSSYLQGMGDFFSALGIQEERYKQHRKNLYRRLHHARRKKAIWKAYAYYQQYVWSHSEDEKRSIVLYCNYDNLTKDNRQLPCVKCTPLEFAPDGRVWLSLGITTTEPHQKNDIFGIQNITRGEIVTYDMQTDQWTMQKVPTLSPKERVILLLMGQGLAVQSVAERLGMSENTVATHRKNIFRKLEAHTVAEAMAFAVKYKAI